jgi:hypothetical protein
MRPEFRKSISSGAKIENNIRRPYELVDHGKEQKPILAMKKADNPQLRKQADQGIRAGSHSGLHSQPRFH